jgi:hypothetical protein
VHLISTADAALRFDPATGMFDASYAAAWQLGRLLGLGSPRFASAMAAWRRSLIDRTNGAVAQDQVTRTRGATLVARAPARDGAPSAAALTSAALDALAERLRSAPEDTAGRAGSPVRPQDTVARSAAPGPALPSSTGHARAVREAVADPGSLRVLLGDDLAVPAEIGDWLAARARLEGIPLPYLLPDPAMLPAESIRFFHLDPNWIVALLGGATSLGRASTADVQHDAAVAASLHQAAATEAEVTGFILRSAVVEGWPRMTVVAHSYGPGGHEVLTPPLPVLRLERIAPGILLCLVAGVIGEVHLREPAEGLHFGLDVDDDDNVLTGKRLRALTGPHAGTADQDRTPDIVSYRGDGTRRIIDVEQTAHTIEQHLSPPVFTAAELALQLVEGAQSVCFVATGGRP